MVSQSLNYPRLLSGMLLTLILSLSVHVLMLQVLHVPFPEFAGISVWASFLNAACAVFAMIVVYGLAMAQLSRYATLTQCMIVFLLYAMLKETLRGILMNGVVTTGWGFDVVAGLPGLAHALILMSLVVIIAPLLRRLWAKVAGASVIAAAGLFVIRPALNKVLAPALKAAEHLNHNEIYTFPYGWQVLVPAYVTYVEPVVACALIAALIWHRLSVKPALRMLQFCILILLIRGMLLPTFVYSFYSKSKLPLAMLSQSQFLFETLTLALLTAFVWQSATPSSVVKA